MNYNCKIFNYTIFLLLVISNLHVSAPTKASIRPIIQPLNNEFLMNEMPITTAQVISHSFQDEWWFRISIFLVISYILYISRRNKLASVDKHHKEQEAFARQLIETEEVERERIAHELHDSLGQNLLVIKNILLTKMQKPQIEGKSLHEVTELIAQSIEELRSITHNLHPHLLHQLGLTKTINSLVNQLNEFSEITVTAKIDDLENLLDPKEEINLLRIIQEIFNNIVKHSKAKNADIVITSLPDCIKVLIKDDGIGIDKSDIKKHEEFGHGFGLYGLKKRAHVFNWDYEITSTPGVETEISLLIPLKRVL